MESTTTKISTEATATAARSFADQTFGEKLFSLGIFGLGLGVSGLFAYYLFTDPSRLLAIWSWTRSLPLLVQGVIWLLFLPWMIALWIWTMPWWMPVRFVLVIGCLLWTMFLLYPWK
jgi:hypothetical protein